jgi:ribose transport system permease protein
MKKLIGIFVLLIVIWVVATLLNPVFAGAGNVENIAQRISLFGIIGIGVAFVIMTGGIDLSIGSVIAFSGTLLALFLQVDYQPTDQRFIVVMADAEARTILVEGEGGLSVDDQVLFTPAAGKNTRTFSIAAIRKTTGGRELEVRERILKSDLSGAVAKGSELSHLKNVHMPVPLAVGLVLLISALIGLKYGLFITKLNLPPFLVTLCGLLVYRGLARFLTGDQATGFGSGFVALKNLARGDLFYIPVPLLNWIAEGNWGPHKWDATNNKYVLEAGEKISLDFIAWIAVPTPLLILAVVAIVAAVALNFTLFGRYLTALGRNEEAVRYSGIRTDWTIIAAYVICTTLAGLAGILFALDSSSVTPSSAGNFYELYAIAAAVLGGCSLRGGEGTILGVLIGTAIMRSLYAAMTIVGIPSSVEFTVIGMVIFIGVVVDEIVRRLAAYRKRIQSLNVNSSG